MNIKALCTKGLTGDCLALLAGIILAFAYAPFYCFVLPFISLTLLLGVWIYVDKRTAFKRGFLFGLGLFGVGVSWVYVSIHTYGQTPSAIAAIITAGFIAYLALFPAYTGYLFARFFTQNNATKILYAFPALWVLLEWTRSWIFTGFPWLMLGYTQMHTPLKYFAPISGVYMISFAIALGSALIIFGLLGNKKRRYRCAIGFASIWLLALLLSLISWTKPTLGGMKVSLVQGNITEHLKWDEKQLDNTLSIYRDLTEKHWGSDIVVWPEAAIPALPGDVSEYLDALNKTAREKRTSIIVGLPTRGFHDERLYNSLIVIGSGYGAYSKRHLVPFGEFVPEREYLKPLLDYIKFPAYDMAQGHFSQAHPDASGVLIAPYICYESGFSELVKNTLGRANLIVTISDDSWFGDSWAVDQHLQMTQMRALETGRYALFVNNSGSSAIINAQGNIVARAPDNTRVVLSGNIRPMTGYTPWLIIGMNVLLLVLIIMLVVAGRVEYKLR